MPPVGSTDSERVNQVILHAGQPRLLYARHFCWVVLQVAVQHATVPPRKLSDCVRPQLPASVDLVLQDVRWRALIAFGDGCQHGVLFLPVPGVSELQVILVLSLTYTDVSAVLLVLLSQVGKHREADRGRGPGNIRQRVRSSGEVILKFKQQVYRETRHWGLDRVVEDEIKLVESGIEMRRPGCVEVDGVRHAIGSKDAIRELRKELVPASGTTRALA